MKAKRISNMLADKQFKVVRVSKTEFELDTGDIYPLPFELDEELSIEEFQKILDGSEKPSPWVEKAIIDIRERLVPKHPSKE